MKYHMKTEEMTFSALIMAAYMVCMYGTQWFAFGFYQIRIATALYAMAFFYPFLILPLGLANMLSNMLMGGMGAADIAGGLFVGIMTSGLVFLTAERGGKPWMAALPIFFVPSLLVPVWLSWILHIPYLILALHIAVGQAVPAAGGILLIRAWRRYSGKEGVLFYGK